MIQQLSFLNIVLAILYVLVYLKSGTFNSTAGILMIIVFNWLGSRSFELDDYRWRIWHYFFGLWSLYFIGTLIYGAVNILGDVILYKVMGDETLSYLIINFVFCISVAVHLIIYLVKNYKQSIH